MESYILQLVLAVGMALYGLYTLIRAWRLYRASASAWYSVESRRMRSTSLRWGLQAFVLVVAGASLLIWIALRLEDPVTAELTPSPTETVTRPPIVATAAPEEDAAPAGGPTPTPGIELSVESGVSTLIPIPTVDLGIQAVVTNTGGGGLWLRDAPFGNGLVLLPEGAMVSVRGGLVEVEGLMWQSVSDPDGREGWVAADYLIYR
jgi:hypothetical protein